MIPRKRILNIWMENHQVLSDEEQDKFLSRAELDFLSTCDEKIVRQAIIREAKLKQIEQIVKDELRPAEAFSHETVDTTMYQLGIGYNDTRPQHPNATCPSCKASLVLKENSKTLADFWGCPNWRFDGSKCRIVINISRDEALEILNQANN